jgi:hypothetical protein
MTNFANLDDIGHDKLQTLRLEAQQHQMLESERSKNHEQRQIAAKALRFAVRQWLALEIPSFRRHA